MKPLSPSPLALALCETVVQHALARLLAPFDDLDAITRERRVNEAVAGHRSLETLAAEELLLYQQIVSDKIGDQLLAAARIAREALDGPTGRRVWLNDAHARACTLFHRALVDYADGRDPDPLRVLVAQTILVGTARARNLLGRPVKGEEKRKPTAAREFLADDYPDPVIRSAIVGMAFNDDADAIAMVRGRSCTLPADEHGRLSLLLDAHTSEDDDARSALCRLAGQIIADDPFRFVVRAAHTADPQPAPPRHSLLQRAFAAAESRP